MLCCSGVTLGQAQSTQDTLQIGFDALEQLFFQRNFQLLAQRYQIEAAQANEIQARLRPNPTLWLQTNLYNPNTGKILPLATPSPTDLDNQVFNSGYFAIQVQQLIQLAGKRNKLVELAASNHKLAILAFQELLRTLRYQLYSTYASIYFDLRAVDLLNAEAKRQQQLIQASKLALQTGGVAPYELLRLEVALRDLQTTIATYQTQILSEQHTLHVLLRQNDYTFIRPDAIALVTPQLPNLKAVLDSALINRPDAAMASEQVTYAERNYALERARRIPDLTAGILYERYGNAYTNFTGLQLSMDLPFFNRNQGAIKVAQITARSAQASVDQQQLQLQHEVYEAHQKLRVFYDQHNSLPADYLNRVETIAQEATKTYHARIIGLLDYLDKIRTFQSAQLNYLALQNNIFQAQQQLNYTSNARFF